MSTSNRDVGTRNVSEFLKTSFPELTSACTRQITTGDFMIEWEYGPRRCRCELTSDEFEHEGWQGILAEKISAWIYQGAI
jgi:hypothetical protein